MREHISNNCPFIEELLKAICRGDTRVLAEVFGTSGARRLISLYQDLNVHQQQVFIVMLPSAVARETQRFRANSKAGAHIAAAIGKTLIRARATDYDSVVVNHITGTMDGVDQRLLSVDG